MRRALTPEIARFYPSKLRFSINNTYPVKICASNKKVFPSAIKLISGVIKLNKIFKSLICSSFVQILVGVSKVLFNFFRRLGTAVFCYLHLLSSRLHFLEYSHFQHPDNHFLFLFLETAD